MGALVIPISSRDCSLNTRSTPWTSPVNAGASYTVKVSRQSLLLIADVFNVFNTQTVLDYNSFSELAARVPNPDFGAAGVSGVVSGQQFTRPRQIRIGVRYEF